MEKITLQIIILLIVILTLVGCTSVSDNPNNSQQSEIMNSSQGDNTEENFGFLNVSATTEGYETAKTTLSYGRNMIFESSIGLYFQNNLDYSDEIGTLSMIEYAESPLGPWIPLCGKPNCLHNSKDCNANIGANMLGMYNNRLYYSDGGTGASSMALDGSGHKSEFSISDEYFIGDAVSTSISDGYIYYADRSPQEDFARLFRIRLDEENASDENIEYVVSDEYYFNGFTNSVPFEGGISITTVATEKDIREYIYYVYLFETKELLTPFEEIGAKPEYFTEKYIYGVARGHVYTYDIDTKKVQELFAFDTDRSCAVFCDGTYFYGEEVGYIEPEEPVRQFYVYDMNGNYIGQTDIDVARGSAGEHQMLYETTKEAVLFTASGIPQFDYVILKSDIEKGEFNFIRISDNQ